MNRPSTHATWQARFSILSHGAVSTATRYVLSPSLVPSSLAYNPIALITGMLTPDPAERMTMQDIFHHPWMLRCALRRPYLSICADSQQVKTCSHNAGPCPSLRRSRRTCATQVPSISRRHHHLLRCTFILSSGRDMCQTCSHSARTDRDGDQIMLTAMPYSQFTQTLMLFVRLLVSVS